MTPGFNKEWFVAERAKALAMVLLTRRDDLVIADAPADADIDYLVSVVREGNPAKMVFGIELRATMAPVTAEHANKVLKPTVEWFQRLGQFPYPVCLFYFTVRDEQAF